MSTKKRYKINHEVKAAEVRLLNARGEQLGIFSLDEAKKMAKEQQVDLIEVVPQGKPPVCKLIELGKLQYQEQKREHELKQKQKTTQVKEVKFRPNTDDNDFNIKLKNLRSFIENGDKIKASIRFRGREITHPEFARRLFDRLEEAVSDIAQVDQRPKMEGRQMIMMLSAKRNKK